MYWHYGFSSIELIAITTKGANFGPPEYECDALHLVCLIALVLGGYGPLSVERFLSKTVTASAKTWPPWFLNCASIRHRKALSHQVAASRRFQERVRSRHEESKRLRVQRAGRSW